MAEQDFIKAGFTVVGTEPSENKLLSFLTENYPNIIRDNEINLEELKTVLGLPIDEKVNGYGLNFVGRNFARAKYAQKTEKALVLNSTHSKDIDTTENLLLKGDNLDSLKILKNHYSGQIKCIYIDPPYNTTSEEFVYPDKFDKEEAEVLGLTNLSENDFARMDFSFKTKQSHNGWLAFMYPRLLLARDLLSKTGVIFISIDDNEQANLKLLCDDVFGEENFISNIIWEKRYGRSNNAKLMTSSTEHILFYRKSSSTTVLREVRADDKNDGYSNPDNDPRGIWTSVSFVNQVTKEERPNLSYTIVNPNTGEEIEHPSNAWKVGKEKYEYYLLDNRLHWGADGKAKYPRIKRFFSELDEGMVPINFWKFSEAGTVDMGTKEVKELMEFDAFTFPKPTLLIKKMLSLYSPSEITEQTVKKDDIFLDFFAGSGTLGHAVMKMNAEDGGKRKFILCQIDEPIDQTKKKESYDFCITNNLPPVISSITIERLKRAGEKIIKEVEIENNKNELFEEDKKQVPDIGFKVFDSVDAPRLKVDDKGQILISENETDALSRIYNMIFTIGLDEPTQVPEEVVKDSIYKIGNHYYITNSEKITSDDYSTAIKNGKVFIDGWTASLNGTLQNYKEDVKIVF
jgi:adenine-specific DNA-methyltransferase